MDKETFPAGEAFFIAHNYPVYLSNHWYGHSAIKENAAGRIIGFLPQPKALLYVVSPLEVCYNYRKFIAKIHGSHFFKDGLRSR